MFRKIATLKPSAWLLLVAVLMVAVTPRLLLELHVIDGNSALYIVQPILMIPTALMARLLLKGKRDRIRHKSDKALIIASAMSVWFVLYFLSGLIVTFVHNVVAASWQTIAINVLALGATAFAVEYTRYTLMLQAGRRNIVWFGVLASIVLAIQQLSLMQMMGEGTLVDIIKFIITFVMPAVINNFLLTYLSISTGFGPQLVYGLGLVAVALLPPIIPKYDWYMTSMSAILLAVAVYVMVDRSQGDTDEMRVRRRRRHPKVAFDVMFGVFMVALVLFMTGAFTYKPIVIMSNSMVPVFSRGSVVIVQPVRSPVDIHVGDIIQYEAENKMITHRVVKIDTSEDDTGDLVFTTKGDNNPSKDPPVKQSQVVGIIRSTVPYAGLPTVWLHDISQKH